MAGNADNNGRRLGRGWRAAGWGVAAALLLLPLAAMQVTDEVDWNLADFAAAGALVAGVGVTYELAARMTGNGAYRAAIGIALAAAFMLSWISLAVGIIGSEDNPANLMYGGVLAVGVVGAVIARFRPAGMVRALSATALAQTLVGGVALAAGLGSAAPSFPEAIVFLTGVFAALWLVSAGLFRKAARQRSSAGTAP
ncbi:MAG: hypothetical protein AB7H90_06565 [Alphaproteobacteria bacterium]